MDFSLRPSDLVFRDQVRRWVEQALPAEWRKDRLWTSADDPGWLPIARAWQKKLYEGGWAALSWPKEHGGRGATVIERWLFEEEMDRAGAPRPIAAAMTDLAGMSIARHGNDAQRERFLRPLLAGDEIWCQGFSEPGAGSDLAGLKTRAAQQGDTFVINGQKVWTSRADVADWCYLLCRTEPDSARHKGISAVLVDMKSPGITVQPIKQMNGAAEFCEVFFEDVRAPVSHLVGQRGSGWSIAMGFLAHERGPVWTFTFQRTIRRSLDRLVKHVRGTVDPVIRQRVAQSFIEVELLRLSGYRALTRLLRTGEPGLESSLDKIMGSETDQRLQELAVATLGPEAVLLDEAGFAGSYLFSRSGTIMGGTSEVQRNIIAQRILGLPRD